MFEDMFSGIGNLHTYTLVGEGFPKRIDKKFSSRAAATQAMYNYLDKFKVSINEV